MGKAVLIPPPFQGENTRVPTIALQNPFCTVMQNFNTLGGTFKLRQGNKLFSTNAPGGVILAPANVASYTSSTPKLFEMVWDLSGDTKWYDITSGTPSLAYTIVGNGETRVYTVTFNNVLFYFGDARLKPANLGPQQFDGTTWAPAAYTWPASFNPLGGCVFKNRAYFIGWQSAAYAYSDIQAIAGATTKIDLSSVTSQKAELYAIRSVSLAQNVTPSNLLAFMFSNGEILAYSGAFPDASDWSLASRLQISKVLYTNSVADAKGDTFILTESEILSLRNLLSFGYGAERSEGIGAAIQNRYQQIVQAHIAQSSLYRERIIGIYDDRNDRLIINFPAYVSTAGVLTATGKAFQLIYDFKLGGWYEYLATVAGTGVPLSACYHDGAVYFQMNSGNATNVFKLEGGANFVDDNGSSAGGTVAIAYDLVTAPLPINKYGANEISGIEAVMKSGLYPQTSVKFIADLGRQTTSGQALPDQGSSVAKPMFNVGISGATAVQLEISGSTVSASVGLELYGFNVWYEQGAEGSR